MGRNRKALAVLMRTPMGAAVNWGGKLAPTPSFSPTDDASSSSKICPSVKERMQASITIPTDKIESVDANLEEFSKGYLSLPHEGRRELFFVLAKDFDVNRARVRELMEQYLVSPPDLGSSVTRDEHSECGNPDEAFLASCYRMERNLRIALKPMYDVLFERLNAYPGGLKTLVVLRADLLLAIEKENISSLRALDSYLKEKLITWLSPAALHLHQITWDDPASLLEKVVAYEAVHPIKTLQDLRRRLNIGRRCFGYFHPAIPGEPLIFIEVALLKEVANAIQEVLWDDPPFPENEATCALFYSISSTQSGLSGINLGKFLVKRVIELVRRDMPNIMVRTCFIHRENEGVFAKILKDILQKTLDIESTWVFATLSPIPGYMQWLLSKLASQLKFAKEGTNNNFNASKTCSTHTFIENILLPEEERMICESEKFLAYGSGGIEILYNLLSSNNNEWRKSDCLFSALKSPLMRLCARYLLKEKKRGQALDPVANFHLQNGALVERINWMADPSEKGFRKSAGIMVNYVYRLEKIEENAQSYFSTGHINASLDIYNFFQLMEE